MPRTCTVCAHDDRDAINAEIVEATPKRRIASRFDVSEAAVRRHAKSHLPQTLLHATEIIEATKADTLLDRLKNLRETALRLLGLAEETGDLKAAASFVREARTTMVMQGMLLGEVTKEGTAGRALGPGKTGDDGGYDLSRLTDEELDTFERLLAKVQPASD
jgi:hypothetical protein